MKCFIYGNIPFLKSSISFLNDYVIDNLNSKEILVVTFDSDCSYKSYRNNRSKAYYSLGEIG